MKVVKELGLEDSYQSRYIDAFGMYKASETVQQP
jgi:hypothetical protein